MLNLPIHPMIVHFPIALYFTALGLEAFSFFSKREIFHHSAVQLFVIATLFTPFTVGSGLWEEYRLHMHHPVLSTHKSWGILTITTAWLALLTLWFFYRRKSTNFRYVFIFSLILMAGLVAATAYFGGKLVYEYSAGVEL